MQKLRDLSAGDFLERADNVLAFGLPGVGKSHAACALGHALVQAGHSVLFAPTYQLVQDLLAAKRNLGLPCMLRSLDVFELLILDDIGYVQQTPEEAVILEFDVASYRTEDARKRANEKNEKNEVKEIEKEEKPKKTKSK